MHDPLADALEADGNRVITLDLLGHGNSDRPYDMWRYSMPIFGRQVVGLLDHLEIDEAVIGGTSLGANTTLEVASLAPARVRGMVIEMPVLDNGLLGCAIAFTPMLIAFTFGRPFTVPAASVMRRVPRVFGHYGNIWLDWLSQDPRPSGALLQGLFFGRSAPPREERRTFTSPSIVIGHPRDGVHPFSDAQMLADELPNGRLIEANSIFELRLKPERLTNEIADFVEELLEAEAQQPARAQVGYRIAATANRSPASAAAASRAARSPDSIAPSM